MDGDHGLNLAHDHAVVLGPSRFARCLQRRGAAADLLAELQPVAVVTRKGGDCTNSCRRFCTQGIAMGLVHCRAKVVAVVACQGPSGWNPLRPFGNVR